MQNFNDTPAALHGFSSVVGASGRNSSHQLQPSELQSSPRMPDEYAGMRRPNPHAQNQHPSLYTSQAALMRGYEAIHRARGTEEILQGSSNHASNNGNAFRKEVMDYYLLMSSKEGQRRGGHGFGYGAGLSLLNLDGHMLHQYQSSRPAAGTTTGMSQYPVDYSLTTGSVGNRSGSTGAFSPSNQYNMTPNPSAKGPHVRRQQGQNYPSRQSQLQDQQHRGHPQSRQRLLPQLSNCPPSSAATGSAGKYNSSPQRYCSGGNGGESKINNAASANSNQSSLRNSTIPGNTRSYEEMGPNYPSTDYSCTSNLSLSRRNHLQNLGPNCESSQKIPPSNLANQASISYPKNPPCSLSSSKSSTSSAIQSVPQFSSQEMTKSPMNSQMQQPQFQQNFSPISNPSPAASVVQSPSYSSSPSPLMGSSEGSGNYTAPPAHQAYSLSNPKNSQSYNRLSQVTPQLSPTANSNSSNSSCESSIQVNATNLKTSPGGSRHVLTRKGVGLKRSDQCTSSSLCSTSPHEKQVLDPGTKSLNALTSQVANLTNTVPNNRDKDSGYQMEPSLCSKPTSQQRNTNNNLTPETEGGRRMRSHDIKFEGGIDEDHLTGKPQETSIKVEEECLERKDGMMQQLGETSCEAGLTGGLPVHQDPADFQTERDYQAPSIHIKKQKKVQSAQSLSLSKRTDNKTFSSVSPSCLTHITSESTNLKCPTPLPSLISSSQSNCLEKSEVPRGMPDNEHSMREQKVHGDKIKKEKVEVNENEVEQFKSDAYQGKDVMKEMEASMKNEGEICCPLSKSQEDKADKNHEHGTEGAHIDGAGGVIIATHSEAVQFEALSRQPEATTASSHGSVKTDRLGLPSHCPKKENDSYDFFRDSNSRNEKGGKSVPNNAASHGTKLTNRNSLSPQNFQPSSQKSHYEFSKLHHASERSLNYGRIGQTEDGPSANVNDQTSQQPLQYVADLQKKAETSGLKGQSRGSMALDPGRGHDHPVQQTFPSLLQEVLQGYHTEKRYRPTENLAQQLQTHNAPPFQNMPYQYPHAWHPNSMAENVRDYILSRSKMSMECIAHNEPSSLGKDYLHKRHESKMDQGTYRSWCSQGAESKEMQWGAFDQSKMINLRNNQGKDVQQSSEPCPQPNSKNSCPSDNVHPNRKPTPNELNSSAMQQLLLKAEPVAGNESCAGQVKLCSPSSPLPHRSSLDRRSVIHDLSPSYRTTPERERSSGKADEVGIVPQTGSSVIQQPLSSSVLNHEDSNKEDKVHKAVSREGSLQTMKESLNSKRSTYSHSIDQDTTAQLQNKMLQPAGPQHLDTIAVVKENVTTTKMTPCRTQPTPQQFMPSHNTLSSPPSSKFQSYFQDLDESSHHSASVIGFGLRDLGGGIVNTSPQHSYQLPHRNLHSTQPQCTQPTDKLQIYPQSHSLRHLHNLNDRLEWSSNNNQQSSQDLMISPDSSQSQHNVGIRSTTDVLANSCLPPPPDHHYDIGKMWVSAQTERGRTGIMVEDVYNRSEPTGSVPLPSMSPEVSKQLETNQSKVDVEDVKSFLPMSAPVSKSDCRGVGSGNGNGSNFGFQGKAKIGDTNPLIMRRRVRSFISPIPAKRQHQDISQKQQQMGISHTYGPHLSNSEVRRNIEVDSFCADVPNLKAASVSDFMESRSPPLVKMDGSSPRKGRGLKLEAIVQKITPNIKKPMDDDDEDNSNSTSDILPSVSRQEISYISDRKDHNSSAEGNLSRMETGGRSCLSYLHEGVSLEDIISYRGVEEMGPLPPTAYQCDPLEDSQALKSDLTEKLKARDAEKEGGKDELSPDFTLLGPLPPPPPLPRPVQACSPPLSSSLTDIQQFTTTYQELETRREHTAPTVLRQTLEESEMCLGFDDYSGRDFLRTKSPLHNQSTSHCLLSIPQRSQPHPPLMSAGSVSSVVNQSHHAKPSENVVPKGYFPSGKKRGRPVGSVNKQKRVQGQLQTVSVNATLVAQIPAPVSTATPQAEAQSVSSTISVQETISDDQTPTSPTSFTMSQTVKEETEEESEQRESDVDAKQPCGQKARKRELESELDMAMANPMQKRSVVEAFKWEESSVGLGGHLSPSDIFKTSRKPVFAPYIHIERKLEDVGNVCTIVNTKDEKRKGDSGEERGGGSLAPVNSTLASQVTCKEGEKERMKEKRHTKKENASDIHSSTTGKACPSSGFVIPGSVMTEGDTFSHLLCCLCQKWANYKDLGDLYGPFYPPEYAARFPKNPTVIRASLAATSVSNAVALAGAADVELTKLEMQCRAADQFAAPTMDTEAAVRSEDRMSHCSDYSKVNSDFDKEQNVTFTHEGLKQEDRLIEISPPVQNPQHVEDTQKRLQHRKLTSHPRFKRRHKSGDTFPKTGPSNSKAYLPFQPPPPLPSPTQDPSDLSTLLSLLPRVPLDPDELWIHEACMIWASGVYLVNGRLHGIQEALEGAKDAFCSHCKAMGSTLGCYTKGCTLRYHYLCATEAGCALNEDNFSMRCPKHKFLQNNRPVKPVCLEQSERG